MKTTTKLLMIALLSVWAFGSYAQNNPPPVNPPVTNPYRDGQLYVYANNPADIPAFDAQGNIQMQNTALKQVLQQYHVQSFVRTFPTGKTDAVKNTYSLTCNCDANQLITALQVQAVQNANSYKNIERIGNPLLLYIPNDYYANFDSAYYLTLMHAPQAWDITKGDPNIHIGISDDGFDTTNTEIHKYDYVAPGTFLTNISTHGTVVAGLAAAKTDNNFGGSGMGYNCRLEIGGISLSSSSPFLSLLQMSQNGAKVINTSWMTGAVAGYIFSPTEQAVINEIWENGTLVVAAAGNGYDHEVQFAPDADKDSLGNYIVDANGCYKRDTLYFYAPSYCAGKSTCYVYPASYNHVLSVTSCVQNKFIPTLCGTGYVVTRNDKVGLVAASTTGPTSYAAPNAAGVAGLIYSINPNFRPEQVAQIMKCTADPSVYAKNPLIKPGYLGAGLVDAFAAVQLATTMAANPHPLKASWSVPCSLNGAAVVTVSGGSPPYNYHWTTGEVTSSINLNPSMAGTTLDVTVTDNACGIVILENDLAVKPKPNAGADRTVCSNDTTVLGGPVNLAQPGHTYAWRYSSTGSVPPFASNQHNPTVGPFNTGNIFAQYTFILRDTDPSDDGCTAEDTVIVNVNPSPAINASTQPYNDCIYPSIQQLNAVALLYSNGAASYSWTPTTGLSDPHTQNPLATITAPTDYTVQVTDGKGCKASADVLVTPILAADDSATIVSNSNVTWNNAKRYMRKIIIQANASLTINNSQIDFVKRGYIQVMPGGTLQISNSHIGNDYAGHCNYFWQGILASGNIGITDTLAHIFLDGDTISGAKAGINYTVNQSNTNANNPTVLSPIITANNTLFSDNETGINLLEPQGLLFRVQPVTSAPTVSINTCTFNTDLNINASRILDTLSISNPVTHISGAGPFAVHITGSRFLNNNPTASVTGISGNGVTEVSVTANSLFTTLHTGISISQTALTVDGSSFGNLFEGILVANAGVLLNTTNSMTNNTFTNIPRGIYIQGNVNDVIHNNVFNGIPHVQDNSNTDNNTYGIRFVGGSGYKVENNRFAGDGIATGGAFNGVGSHGIVTDNSANSAPVIFSNFFSESDYGVHTENNNMSLKIRCNNFADDGVRPHFVSSWYSATGQLRDQGSPLCQPAFGVGGSDSAAAGNTWLSPSCSSYQDIFVGPGITFNYYANPRDAGGNTTTVPACNSSSWTGLNATCVPANANSCRSAAPGVIIGGGGIIGTCTAYTQQLQAGITNLLGQRSILQTTILNLLGGLLPNQQVIAQLKSKADDLAKEAQLVTNELVRTVIVCPGSGSLKNTLTQSPLIEPKRLLAGINLGQGNATDLLGTLATITQMNNSLQWNNAVEKALIQADNTLFVNYMTILANAMSQNRAILSIDNNNHPVTGLTQGELSSIRTMANAKQRTSALAQTLLTTITGEQFVNTITKFPAGGSRIGGIAGNGSQTGLAPGMPAFKLYPNPNDGTMNIEYAIGAKETGVFELLDVTGRVVAKYMLNNEANTLTINNDQLLDGVYIYRLKVNEGVVLKNKVVIVH